jgi:hypothetical protein
MRTHGSRSRRCLKCRTRAADIETRSSRRQQPEQSPLFQERLEVQVGRRRQRVRDYIWRENADIGQYAFKASLYALGLIMSAARCSASPTTPPSCRSIPTTKFKWASLPGTPASRRPATCSSSPMTDRPHLHLLDLHTPFNADTSIQSYSTHIYVSSSQEIHRTPLLRQHLRARHHRGEQDRHDQRDELTGRLAGLYGVSGDLKRRQTAAAVSVEEFNQI